VFIDEESCIGCMQCVNVSPGSFLMMDSGRARTFEQRHAPDVKQAVASCPVNCMHPVTFTELEEYETARDEGDGRNDHKHLGHRRGHTPLYVAGIDSDNNHRTSWYHTLKGKCVTSSQCPQKGCFDCPRYAKPGDNPYFQKHQQDANHIRAQYFIQRGDVDALRKVAEL
jgi:ferredoxin